MTWTVVENTPGYLPENDEPGVFEDLEDAKLALREDVQRYVEHGWEVGDNPGVSWSEDGTYAYGVSTTREHDLGRVFEVLATEEDSKPGTWKVRRFLPQRSPDRDDPHRTHARGSRRPL